MSNIRIIAAGCLLVFFICVLSGSAGADGLKIGVFPLRRSVDLAGTKFPDRFLPTLTQNLLKELEKAGVGEITVLNWPDQLAAADQPTFETLVNRGKEQGCNGVLALQVSARSFTKKDVKVPLVGSISTAEAEFTLSGGLIDVSTAEAAAGIRAESKKTEKPYRGPNPNTVLNLSFGQKDYDNSPLAKAVDESVLQVVTAVKDSTKNLTQGTITVPQRANAPAGVGFSQDAFQMVMTPGYDKRSVVSVVNRGQQPQTFIVTAVTPDKELAVGLMGEGTMDGPCTLAPGQWKDIRIVANSEKVLKVDTVSLALYATDKGKKPSVQDTPSDSAVMNLKWETPSDSTSLTAISQDPVTLAYTCKLQNKTGNNLYGVSIAARNTQTDMVQITPNIHNACLPANGSIVFQVVPKLWQGMRSKNITIETVVQGAARIQLPLDFTVPSGKAVYYGLGHTSESSSSASSGCVNKGSLEVETNWKGQTREEWEKTAYFPQGEDKSPDYKWSLRLSVAWWWVLTHINSKEEMEEWRRRENERPRAADVRGATIRPNVSQRLPNMETDCFTHPMASRAKDCQGFVFYTTPKDSSTIVFFAREIPSMDGTSRLEYLPLSQKDHKARWPYIRTRWETSQAFVVWEDSASGKGSDVAYRASGKMMQDWSPVQYLTNHGKGVDDPVVHVNDKGTVVAAWNDLRDGAGQVYLKISQDGGKTFGAEVAVPRAQGESQAWPQIDFASDGGYALVYVSKTGTQSQILTRRLDKNGKPQGETTAISNKDTACGEPQISCDKAGTVYSVWREGEGDASEVWFSRCPANSGKWTPAKKLTDDKVYSEYPLIWATDKALVATYHSDANGVVDLKYAMESSDGGETWGERIAQPTLEGDAAGRAYVELSFALQNPRSTYRPYDTTVFVNDVQVGKLENAIPEGTYVWEVPPGIARCGSQGIEYNKINIKFGGVNGAHYILAANARLIIQRKYTQLPVVAGSQAEADKLAQESGAFLNHSVPDLALAANTVASLPASLQPGQNITLPLQLYNLGEGAASEAKVYIYNADPRDPLADLKSAKLGEVQVGTVGAGEMKPVSISFKYDPANAARVYAAVYSKEKDFNTVDNSWGFSFTKGESNLISPLFGTDIPNVIKAPDLVGLVDIPDLKGLMDVVSLPNLGSILGKANLKIPSIEQFTSPLSGIIKNKKLPGFNLGNLLKK